jgi:hypothetical protein
MILRKNNNKMNPNHGGDKTLNELGGLSLVHPFWGEAKRFDIQFENWVKFSKNAKNKLEIIIIDDHGDPPIHTLLTSNKLKYLDFTLLVYRITDDLKWNTPGALNLGFTVASNSWTLIMDSDCMFMPDVMDNVLDLNPSEGTVYKFDRIRIEKDRTYEKRWLTCTMLMHKRQFWGLNGFDEDFTGAWSGGYGFFDNDFDRRRGGSRNWGVVEGIRATEYMHDLVGRVDRDHGKHHRINRTIMTDKAMDRIPQNNHILNFAWEKVFDSREIT